MKRIAFIFLSIVLASCSDDADDNVIQNTNRELTILKVDFLSNTFEGGKSFTFNDVAMSSSLPLEETYVPPSDFGNYTLKYTPTNEVIFNGPLSWLGGSYDLPLEYTADEFEITSLNPTINFNNIEYFLPTADIIADEGYTSFDYTSVWDAIKRLQVTNDCINNNGKIGFVLYTPGVGLFQPENAYWLVILYK